MNTLKQHLESAVPFEVNQNDSEKKKLDELAKAVEEASLEAHRQLYDGFHEGDPRVVTFTDDLKVSNKYISFSGKDGKPCYFEFVPGNSATDIGLRGINPNFDGVINPTTVVHADIEAVDDFRDFGAPQSVIDALDAVSLFNGHIIRNIVRPYLGQVAEEYGLKPREFTEIFYPAPPYTDRDHTVTRMIMYHRDAKKGMRPVGKDDGVPLLIGQHNDKSVITVNAWQTGKGLQNRDPKTKEWVNADNGLAIFRGSASSFIPENPPATAHRVVFEDDSEMTIPKYLSDVGIARDAIVSFISATRPPLVARPQTTKSRY